MLDMGLDEEAAEEDPKLSEGSKDRRDLALVAVSGGAVNIMFFVNVVIRRDAES